MGIYIIINKINNDCYVGKSVDIKRRWYQHKTRYNKVGDKSYNLYLYRAFRKYGIENFEFKILEYCSKDELIDREQYYYDMYKPKYCMVQPHQDYPMDEKLKKRMSQKGKESWNNHSEETKDKILKKSKKGCWW